MPAFVTLLVFGIAAIMILPLFAPDTAHLAISRVAGVATLMLALWAAGVGARILLFSAPVFLAYLIAVLMGGRHLSALALSIRAFFFCYAIAVIVAHILRAQKVTGDMLAGAACAYLLTGIAWANFYEILELLRPGSFDIPSAFLLQPHGDPTLALQYFSFTTLTTVGYGDVHPSNIRAAGLAIGEAVVDQLYVAIMIARVVSLHLVQRS
jgi:hypothetical protein